VKEMIAVFSWAAIGIAIILTDKAAGFAYAFVGVLAFLAWECWQGRRRK
jgi:hypothetical protein